MTTAGTEDAVGATVAAVHLVKRTCTNLDTPQKSHSTKNRALTGSWKLETSWEMELEGRREMGASVCRTRKKREEKAHSG